jgi:hypothetical protein
MDYEVLSPCAVVCLCDHYGLGCISREGSLQGGANLYGVHTIRGLFPVKTLGNYAKQGMSQS